jgi:hypothetical protein
VSVQQRRAPLGTREERQESEDDDFLELFVRAINTDKESGKLWYKSVNIFGRDVSFKLDTGSEANILPINVHRANP